MWKTKNCISHKLHFDMASTIISFQKVCKYKLALFSGSNIMPGLVIQDVIENLFCRIRSRNGNNNNPTVSQYGSSLRSVIISQTLISRKANAGSNVKVSSMPLSRQITMAVN